ncbi:MAG: hypothetical protein Q8Q95_02965 [bacterium]|nr:hypothetical protein [bacterium]
MVNLTKKDIQQLLGVQTKELTKELKSYTDEQTEKLARIVAVAFENQDKRLDRRFDDLEKKLDVRKIIEEHERKFVKLEQALNLKF